MHVCAGHSVVELVQEGASGLSVLRTVRLLRLLKLVRFMPALRYQLVVMLRTMDSVATFCALLVLFIFIFRSAYTVTRVVTTCYSNDSDRPHRRRRTDRSIVFARWHRVHHPHLALGSLDPRESVSSGNLDRFNRFCVARGRELTDRPTR